MYIAYTLRLRAGFCLLALTSSFHSGATASEQVAEYALRLSETVNIPVSEFVSPNLLKGTGYSLQEDAVIQRSIALFRLNTPYGETAVVGTVSLLERINEIQAVSTLEEMKKSDVYVEALKKSGRGPVEAVKGLVNEPVDTVSNMARGVGSFFADIGYSIVSDDPSQENVAKTALGFATAKRKFAYELGVNPYSSYEPLQEELGDVAWTAVAGGMTVAAGFRAVKGGAGQALTISRTANSMRQLVRDNSPRKLQNINSDKLISMGVTEDLAEAFLNNPNFDPEAETRMVGALEAMKGVPGRSDFVALATLATNRGRALILRDSIELAEAYHTKIQPVTRIVIISTAPFLVTADQRIQVVLPTDFLTRTPGIEARTDQIMVEIRQRGLQADTVWATGKADEGMRDVLRSQGWRLVKDHAEKALRSQ